MEHQELHYIPNTYSRWCDKALAEAYSENIHGYKYNEANKNKKTERANKNRSLGQKLHYFATEMKEYSEDEIRELYAYLLIATIAGVSALVLNIDLAWEENKKEQLPEL